MKTIMLALAFMLSLNFSYADDGENVRKNKKGPRAKITYSENNKYKKTFAKKRIPKKRMFAGEGVRKNEFTMFGKQERNRRDKR